MSAFTTTIKSTEEVVDVIDEEEELMELKFEKMDDQDDIHTAYTVQGFLKAREAIQVGYEKAH